MSWYKITLSSADISDGRQGEMQEAFYDLFVKCGSPRGVGMFSLIDVMQYVFYLSPAAAQLAMPLITIYNGVPCEAPKESEVRKLYWDSAVSGAFPFAPEA